MLGELFMKFKLYGLCIIFFIGCAAYASAIIERPVNSHPSAMQRSNIINYAGPKNYSEDYEYLKSAINELNEKIKKSPGNYALNISLADLYIKNKQYDKSYYELIYLYNLSKGGKLNAQNKNEILNIYNNLKKQVIYSQNKSLIYINLAIMALISEDNAKAEKYTEASASINTDQNILKDAIKKVFDETQNYSAAVSICDKLLTFKPSDNNLRELKAYYLIQMKDKNSAIKEYAAILDYNPEDIKVKYELYKLLISENKQSKDIINEMYKGKLKEEDALNDLANMLLKNNNVAEAKKYANILADKYQENANGYILLAEIYRKEGKLKESYEVLNKVRDKADSNEAISQYNVLLAKLSDEPLQEANSLMAAGLYSQALSVLESSNQENLYVILAQARAYYFLKQKQKSLDYLNKAMTLYPANSDVFCAFGYIYLQENDLESANKYVNESLKINPDNQTAQSLLKMVNKSEAEKYVNGIISSFEAQNYPETMNMINEALKISPDYALLHYYKGLTYIAQNKYADSTASLYKCIELDKNNSTAYFYLGIAFDNLSEPQNALNNYKKFIQLLPKDELGESDKVEYAKDRISKIQNSK